MINVFSAVSLKLLEKSTEEFIRKYERGLFLNIEDESAILGKNLHKLISYYINGFEIEKILSNLGDEEKSIFEKLIERGILKKHLMTSEKSFLVPVQKGGLKFFLTGRFDVVQKEEDKVTIIDWKTSKLPTEPQKDLQTIVYLYCASKLFKTKDVTLRYITLKNIKEFEINFDDGKKYEDIIFKIVSKYLFQ